MGGGCNIALPSCLRCGRGRRDIAARLQLDLGGDIGWNPVTNLNFDFELMYQSTIQAAPSGFIGTVYNLAGWAADLPAGRLEGRQRRFRRTSPLTRYF